MKNIIFKTIQAIKNLSILLYALLLLITIPYFFFNYGGEWMHKIANSITLSY